MKRPKVVQRQRKISYRVLRVIFFVNGTPAEAEKERTGERGTGRSPGRYQPRGGLYSPLPRERTRKLYRCRLAFMKIAS